MLALGILGGSAAAAQEQVMVPPLWYSGDTHAHVQLCGDVSDLALDDIYAQQVQNGLDLVHVLLWANDEGEQGIPAYYLNYAPLVTGTEAPLTQGDPDHTIQYGVEVSMFAASDFGHLIAINVADGAFPNEVYPAPILDFFQAQPGALTGYAHARWYDGYGRIVPSLLPHVGAAMAPIDTALGRVDFLEAAAFSPTPGLSLEGLYYKLLNAGLRVALTGGSDNTCIAASTGSPRAYAFVDSDPLTLGKWAAAVRSGRSTVASDEHTFLNLSVQGMGIGDQLSLSEPGLVQVVARLRVTPGVAKAGNVEIVLDGNVVGTLPYDLPDGGVVAFTLNLQLDRSGWIAARTDQLEHTSAIYAIVAGQPICRALDASYWVTLCDDMIANIEEFELDG